MSRYQVNIPSKLLAIRSMKKLRHFIDDPWVIGRSSKQIQVSGLDRNHKFISLSIYISHSAYVTQEGDIGSSP